MTSLSSNYERIKSNIVSYSDDLIMLTKKVKEDTNYLTTLINDLAASIKEKSKNMID